MKISVGLFDGELVVTIEPDGATEETLTGIVVRTPDGPILGLPFYAHGKRLHTVCSRHSDAIERIQS